MKFSYAHVHECLDDACAHEMQMPNEKLNTMVLQGTEYSFLPNRTSNWPLVDPSKRNLDQCCPIMILKVAVSKIQKSKKASTPSRMVGIVLANP